MECNENSILLKYHDSMIQCNLHPSFILKKQRTVIGILLQTHLQVNLIMAMITGCN